jgi:hypothetical protein
MPGAALSPQKNNMTCRNLYFSLAGAFIAILFLSCTKEESGTDIFYGQWKTSYGDTISFYSQNGSDILEYKIDAFSPGPPANDPLHEYFYQDDKLSIRDDIGPMVSVPFRELTSFKWVNKGIQFKVQGVQWFPFMSATTTVFTFTKIQ